MNWQRIIMWTIDLLIIGILLYIIISGQYIQTEYIYIEVCKGVPIIDNWNLTLPAM